jgi:hypothetical protein
LNECDWPLRIFVMAMTSAAVVAAAPARLHQSAYSRKTE